MRADEYKPGDVVKRKNNGPFSHGKATATVDWIEGYRIWLVGTATYTTSDYIELVATKVQGAASDSQHLKADGGKLQWTLVMNGCAKAILGVVKVMTVAITPKPLGRGYAKNSWKEVPEATERYRDALYRHLAAIERGEIWDDGTEGTGQLHWDCVTTNALFLSEFAHGEYDGTNAVPTA